MSDGSRLALDRVRIITDGASGVGANGGYLAAGDLTVEAPAGNGIIFWQTGTVTLERVDITALQRGVYITNTAALIASDLNIRTTGTTNGALFLLNSATAEVCRALIETAGDNAIAVWVQQYSTLNLVSGTLRTSGSNGNGIYAMSGCGVTLGDTAIETQGSDAHGLDILSGATIVTGSDVRIKVSGSATWGVRIVDGQVELENSSIIASGANAGGVTVTGTGALLLNNTDINAETGHAITTGSLATAELNLDGNTITGDLTAADGSVLTVIGSNGTVINGDLTGSGTAAINLTLSGSDSTLLGDIAQHDNTAAVTVILNDSATGQGGYNGGNLITGGDSTWTFNKDSHGNHGENHGVWNLGDYDVIFDNLTHSGTININVNSDTGEGGSITITGAADGDGIVHIDTTGNGKADPNQVLPGVVTGDGTDHWQWDPIDWGIDTIIKDGDHFIKQGTSPAGAVLNSSVAIQQAMWFAQQNSLLKRMGDLRYGARASRPLAGGTPAFHNLIENLWLRSYGQQLNVGSKVSGKAYEQLIYGVDLGTDHKFTISADSDLYLGVYAGYGRSDIDYRTPGTDGEINSYYGGLYATWLYASGFYIDVTVKAASVNNDLKAPYGTTQLTANYSDINLGGSLEIGKKFTFSDAWFIEPQFQVNYLHILAENYTAGPMTLKAQDLDALQLRLGSLFGRTIKLTNGGALQPYVKISGVETISSGGTLRNGYQHTRANTDGARAELGAGLIWQLDADNQLHLDYEASFGDKYDKPWGLTAGYRHQF